MKKILVATDFSSCAANAMEYAMDLAKLLDWEICVIHAIGVLEGVNNNTYSALYISDYQNHKKEALDAWAATFSIRDGFKKIPVTTVCEVGSVSSVLGKYIENNPVELLVMGNMGSTGIIGLFGSNVSAMIEKTKTPILILPLESKFTYTPTLTLATDFSTKLSPEDTTVLGDLAQAFGSPTVTVLNVIEGNDWNTKPEGEAALRSAIPGVDLDFHYISEGNTIDGIMNFVVSNEIDILCLVKHHHNVVYRLFNRSTVNQVMNRSVKAILVLHE
jgi:nucleotide-binding universal stress UspA family protein